MSMNDHGVKYSVLASGDSAIFVEVLRTRLFKKEKYFLSFEDFTGELYYVQQNPEQSQFALQIDARSITCRDSRLKASKQRRVDKHAKDLILSTTPSTIQFTSQQISTKPLRGFVVEGTGTIRGVTRPLKMNASFHSAGTDGLEMDSDFILRFSEWGIKTPSSLAGLIHVNDEALVQIHLHATLSPTETA